MKLDARELCLPALNTDDAATTAAGDRVVDTRHDRPAVLTHGERRVVFGPGIDDFNAFDDPC